MYGLPEADVLANKLLKTRQKEHDYFEVKHTRFTLTADDFGAKYIGNEHAEHLMPVLGKHYNMEEDWKGKLYYGIRLKWNYREGYVDISMTNYVRKKTPNTNTSPPISSNTAHMNQMQ